MDPDAQFGEMRSLLASGEFDPPTIHRRRRIFDPPGLRRLRELLDAFALDHHERYLDTWCPYLASFEHVWSANPWLFFSIDEIEEASRLHPFAFFIAAFETSHFEPRRALRALEDGAFDRVVDLDLSNRDLNSRALSFFDAMEPMPHLRTLSLGREYGVILGRNNRLRRKTRELAHVLSTPGVAHVQALYLEGESLGDEGLVEALAHASCAPSHLDLSHDVLHGPGLIELSKLEAARHIDSLDLMENILADEHIEGVLEHFELRHLGIGGLHIGESAIGRLCASEGARSLTSLDLRGSIIDENVGELLARSPNLVNLTSLELSTEYTSYAALTRIASSSTLTPQVTAMASDTLDK